MVEDVKIFAFRVPYSIAQTITQNIKPVYKIESIENTSGPANIGAVNAWKRFELIAKPIARVYSMAESCHLRIIVIKAKQIIARTNQNQIPITFSPGFIIA